MGHRKKFWKQTFWALALHSDEGLTLKMSAFKLLTVAILYRQLSW